MSDSEDSPKENLVDLAEDFHTGMLVTRALNGDLRSRPMAVAKVEDDGTFYFTTDDDAAKVEEIGNSPEVNISFQQGRKYLSLSGRATILNDRELIAKLWKPDWKIWFPEGKDDPNLRLVKVEGRRGEYWDVSGTEGIAFLWNAGKALIKGERMGYGGEHEKVELGPTSV